MPRKAQNASINDVPVVETSMPTPTPKPKRRATTRVAAAPVVAPVVVDNKPKGNTLAITLACIAVVLSGTSAVFSYLSFEKANTPLTILNSSGTEHIERTDALFDIRLVVCNRQCVSLSIKDTCIRHRQ